MRSIREFIAFCGIVSCMGIASSPALAGSPPSTCLSPLQQGEADPQPRDVHFTVANDKKSVSALACVVSNRDQIAGMTISFSAFDETGKLVGSGGQDLEALPSTNDLTPNEPKIITIGKAGFRIDLGRNLLNKALVSIRWFPCQSPAPAPCVPGNATTSTFIREVVFYPTEPTPHRHHRRH